MRFRYHNNVCYHFSAGGREGGRKTSSRLSKPPRLMASFLLKAQHVYLILTLKTWKQFSNFRPGSRPLSGHSSQGKLKHSVVTINWLSWLHLQLCHWGIAPVQHAQHTVSCGPLLTHQKVCMRLKCAKGRRQGNCSCYRWRAVTQPEGLHRKISLYREHHEVTVNNLGLEQSKFVSQRKTSSPRDCFTLTLPHMSTVPGW